MGSVVSTLAFPSPNKEWSQADLLQRERTKELVFLKTKSGYRCVFDSSVRCNHAILDFERYLIRLLHSPVVCLVVCVCSFLLSSEFLPSMFEKTNENSL